MAGLPPGVPTARRGLGPAAAARGRHAPRLLRDPGHPLRGTGAAAENAPAGGGAALFAEPHDPRGAQPGGQRLGPAGAVPRRPAGSAGGAHRRGAPGAGTGGSRTRGRSPSAGVRPVVRAAGQRVAAHL